MNIFKKLWWIILILAIGFVFFFANTAKAQTILRPFQGGTGLGTATAGDVGDCLKVTDDSPFTYELGACGGGGSSILLDLADDAANESAGILEIATTGDTNSIFTEPTADKLLINLANDWPKADLADALASNPTDCGANQFAISIISNGNLTCASIADADVPDTITINSALSVEGTDLGTLTDTRGCTYDLTGTEIDCNTVFLTGNQTITLSGDISGSGETAITTAIGNDIIIETDLNVDSAAVDGDLLTYDSTGTNFDWITCAELTGSAGLCDGADNTGGGSLILDFGDDGGNDSVALAEIATTGDTNSIFTEPSADKLLIDLTKDWPKADTSDDLTCTDCINATEIEDIYLLNSGDTSTGALTINNDNGAGSTLFTIGDANDADSAQIFGDLTITGGDLTFGTSLILSGGDTTSLNLIDAIDGTTETTFEGALDIAGEVSSTGMATTVIADSVAVSSWTITTPLFSGKIDADAGAVNDDDCTGEIGFYWYDDTDSAFEFCNADAGVPTVLGGGEATTVSDTTTIDLVLTGNDITANGLYTAGDNLTLTGADFDLDATVTIATSILSPIFSSTTADPADSGILRLANAEGIAWETAPAGADATMILDASEILQLTNMTLDGADLTSGSVTATQLGTDSVSADELNATGVESEIEAQVFDSDAQNILGIWEVADDIDFNFGTDADWNFNYDESVDNQLLISTNNDSAIATTDPMFEILTDFNTANGTTMTANQQVFGVGKGTQASNVSLFTVDAEGDGLFNGTAEATGGFTINATTEGNIETAIDTLASLTSIQSRTVTLADAGANAIFGWDDTAGAYENLTQAEGRTVLGIGTAGLVATDLADLNEATIESAIDTLANLTSIQARTVTLADAGANAFFGWDDVAGAYENLTGAEAEAIMEPLIDTLANLTSVQGQTVTISAPFTVPADPGADRILFWDDSAGATAWLTVGSGLSLTDTTLSASGGSAEATTKAITQVAHGLAVGEVVKFSGSIYDEAQATSADNAEVVGIVISVADADNFTLLTEGYIGTLSGLTANTTYFLSDTTAGAITATEPADVGEISKPVLRAVSTTAGYFHNWRGVVISAAAGGLDVQTFTADGTWTKPGSGTRVLVQAWGGGGSGGFGTGGRAGAGGGGGAYVEAWFNLSDLGATETVDIGAGGAAKVAAGNGNNGSNTTFGSWLTAYGGTGGGGDGVAGGTGAGQMGQGAGPGSGSVGGSPVGGASGTSGSGPTGTVGESSTGGAGGGGTYSNAAGAGQNGGIAGMGGGGGGGAGDPGGNGGGALYGGGGGGGGADDSTGGGTGGNSIYGGDGGAGAFDTNVATSGSQPAGGGGGSEAGNSGAGGDGKVIVTVY